MLSRNLPHCTLGSTQASFLWHIQHPSIHNKLVIHICIQDYVTLSLKVIKNGRNRHSDIRIGKVGEKSIIQSQISRVCESRRLEIITALNSLSIDYPFVKIDENQIQVTYK